MASDRPLTCCARTHRVRPTSCARRVLGCSTPGCDAPRRVPSRVACARARGSPQRSPSPSPRPSCTASRRRLRRRSRSTLRDARRRSPASRRGRPRTAPAPAGSGASPAQRRRTALAPAVPRRRRAACSTPTRRSGARRRRRRISAPRRRARRGSRRRSAATRSRSSTAPRRAAAAQSFIELRIPAQNVQQALVAARRARHARLAADLDPGPDAPRSSASRSRSRSCIAGSPRCSTALRDPALPDAQRVLLQIQLAESKRALAQRVHGRKGTIAAGATSRVSLVLTTQKHAAAAPPHRGRLGRMLHSAVGFLALEGMVALFALIVISPVARRARCSCGLVRRRAVDRLLME